MTTPNLNQVDTRLSNIATAYDNPEFIADAIFPRVAVPAERFQRRSYTQNLEILDTRVGDEGEPKNVSSVSTLVTDTVDGHALKGVIPLAEQMRQDARGENGVNMREQTVMEVTNDLLLKREKDVADLVQTAATYATNFSETLTGTAQWSDSSSNPLKKIIDVIRGMKRVKPNVMVCGEAVYDALRTHDEIVKAYNRNSGDSGVVPRDALAAILGLERIEVGKAFGAVGSTTTDIWGNHAALLRVSAPGSVNSPMPMFGYTPVFGGRRVYSVIEPMLGAGGGVESVKVAEYRKEIVVMNDAGYLIRDAVA